MGGEGGDGLMRGLGILAGVAALASASMPAAGHHAGRTRYPAGHKRRTGYGYRPHNGAREVARRLRQAARNKARQMERHPSGVNCGLSRRGRIVIHG